LLGNVAVFTAPTALIKSIQVNKAYKNLLFSQSKILFKAQTSGAVAFSESPDLSWCNSFNILHSLWTVFT